MLKDSRLRKIKLQDNQEIKIIVDGVRLKITKSCYVVQFDIINRYAVLGKTKVDRLDDIEYALWIIANEEKILKTLAEQLGCKEA